MLGLTERFASVEQQEQFLQCTSLTGKDPTDNHPKERTSAHIEEVIDKDLDPPDDSRPDEPPPDKGKGRAEGECPNNNPPDSGDDGNGPGSSDSSSDDDSNGSEALRNSEIAHSICKGLSGLFANIDDNKETARTSNPEPFDSSDTKALNPFFTACATTFIGRPKAYKKQHLRVTYALSFLQGPT